ncbi:hypothetical protein JCM17795_09210 [Galenea microaerophila]
MNPKQVTDMKRFTLLSSPSTLAFTNLAAKTRKLLLLSLLFSFTNVAHAALPLAGSAEAYWLGWVKPLFQPRLENNYWQTFEEKMISFFTHTNLS